MSDWRVARFIVWAAGGHKSLCCGDRNQGPLGHAKFNIAATKTNISAAKQYITANFCIVIAPVAILYTHHNILPLLFLPV